ncbi:hypothetical protein [Moheibacter stercoris]|uniref:Uncharacterized protein n=1 Tax=Moheibacter stercoris TaxID=1628251 RepID=A0ABV2LSS5_9FLAO
MKLNISPNKIKSIVKTFKKLLIAYISICMVIMTIQQINKAKELNEIHKMTFESNEEFLELLGVTSSIEKQQALMRAHQDQIAFEYKFGRSLNENEINPFSPNLYFKIAMLLVMFTTILIIIILIIHFLFNPIIKISQYFTLYKENSINLKDYKSKWTKSLICTTILNLIFIIPTFGLSLILFIQIFLFYEGNKS